MTYKYETHLHTSQGSQCGHNTGREMAIAHKEAGYTGIIVTDHFFYGNTAPNRDLPWDKWVHEFCSGYRDAKAAGDEIGLDVFFGWESGYNGTEFLIYGLDEKWLLDHPEIKDASVEEQFKLVHESGGIVIHAHPFREEPYISEIRLFSEFVDGVEAYNPRNKSSLMNDKAHDYASLHNFPVTAGSDVHNVNVIGSGMYFDEKITSINDFISKVMSRSGELAII